MAIFNDLATELQEAIWNLVLPNSRGVHWVEVEGIPHDPDFIRDSIRMTKWYQFDRIPETHSDVFYARQENPEFNRRANKSKQESSPFFRFLLTTVPAVLGRSGSNNSEAVQPNLVNEITYTNRCRQLSTYTQITTLLSVCRLSRNIAKRYVQDNRKCSWPIRRSMGPPYRPRPIDDWERQYSGNRDPPVAKKHSCWQLLTPRIHTLDLVIFRLHDNKGRATPLLRHAPWQYWIEQATHGTTFACFDRIGVEWHPSWGTWGGRHELRSGNVQAFVREMQVAHCPATLYWLVDSVARPNWNRDYPAVVRDIWANRMAEDKDNVLDHLKMHWNLKPQEHAALLADHHLNQEFEANGRRYYIVFVVFSQFLAKEREQLNNAGLGWSGPFPGSAATWPEALIEPVRLAYDVCGDGSKNLGTYRSSSYILSWEPIH
ncbi:hypothetical protein ST47_g824 [Ascochyta rabiei]|uniref:Uncharacterized protein n=1 Tax=Didymella rabiei TaxID=5454 RepID=A0A163LQB4_DIDRA|nr:hypothetical protein ST47_g824 [Ascochyta rabiei]